MQKSASIVLDSRQASTFHAVRPLSRANQA
jgi:hypothetical protein